MAVFAIQIVFCSLISFANLVSLVIFKAIAYILVAAIQVLRAPGIAINTLLQHATEGVKSAFEYLFELLWDAITSLISSTFDLLVETITGSFSAIASAIGELIGKMQSSLDDLAKALPEILEGASEMIGTIAENLWENYKDAIGYVKEKM